MPQWKWYVYIIECVDGSYYTGMTWKPADRWDQHMALAGCEYTRKHPPKALVYLEEHEDFSVARKREYTVKRWNRAKKEKLISGEWSKDF